MAQLPAAENPFRVERMHALPYWEPGLDHAALLARAERMGWRGALVGPHGNGKTTLLLELATALRDRGMSTAYHCIGEGPIQPRADTILLVDGAERLAEPAWLLFRWRMRGARGLLITAHAEGRLPTLRRCQCTPATVAHVLAALDPPEADTLRARAPELFERYRGDCRRIVQALYDECAGRGPV
jgi:molybdopterin-guanine dinucleotide biosynthesis protein